MLILAHTLILVRFCHQLLWFISTSMHIKTNYSDNNSNYICNIKLLSSLMIAGISTIALTMLKDTYSIIMSIFNILIYIYQTKNDSNKANSITSMSQDFNYDAIYDNTIFFLFNSSLFIFLILRLKETFNNTSYSVRPCLYIITFILWYLSVAIILAFLYSSYLHTLWYLLYIKAALQTTVALIITYSFLHKLLQLTIDITRLDVDSNIAEESFNLHDESYNNYRYLLNSGATTRTTCTTTTSDPHTLTKNQNELINLVTKQTILAFFHILAILIQVVSTCIKDFVIIENEFCTKLIGEILVFISQIITSVTVWFSFAVANGEYYCICNMIHTRFLKIFKTMALKEVEKERKFTSSKHSNYRKLTQEL